MNEDIKKLRDGKDFEVVYFSDGRIAIYTMQKHLDNNDKNSCNK